MPKLRKAVMLTPEKKETRENPNGENSSFTRRQFLVSSGVAAGGLLLTCVFDPSFGHGEQASKAASIPLNAWLRINNDDTVTIIVSQAEIGQGISTTLPAILADELGADWTKVRLENSPTDPVYRNPRVNWQFTGNSESSTSFFEMMRQMGASAREMLITAASERWKVAPATCDAENSHVIHRPSKRALKFGDIAEAASKVPPPKNPRLKPDKEWRLIGRSLPRVDNPSKVDGSAIFGIDFGVPNMVYAAVRQSPVIGGKTASFDKSSVQGLPGVIDVVPIPNGAAVVAKGFWQAQQALKQLKLIFDDGSNTAVSSASLRKAYVDAMEGSQWVQAKAVGKRDVLHGLYTNDSLPAVPANPSNAQESATPLREYPIVFNAEYESQFLAHATMEPMNCTAHVAGDRCEIWAPTQGQEGTQLAVAQTLGLPKANVVVNRTLSGGGFGRRLLADFAIQAAVISKAVGLPVKVIWSREEDIQHDVYRPATLNRITAGIDSTGRLQAIRHKIVSPSILQYVFPPAVTDTYDPSCLEGTLENLYGESIPNIQIEFHLLKVPVPTSVMRTTGYGPNVFAIESFADELADRKGQDPYEYRRELLSKNPRALAVLDMVAEKSAWKQPLPAGHYRGMAFSEAFRTLIAHVVELSVSAEKSVTIHRVVTVADPGTVLDPEITTNSLEGGVGWGLSCAFKSEITFDNGRTVQSNWHDYQVLRMPEMPRVEVYLINSGVRPLGGTGEVGPVTLLPAVTNAIFAATGQRVRTLPLSRHGFHLA
jgi:isoquinoline 1-oxidoreductase subunit beta